MWRILIVQSDARKIQPGPSALQRREEVGQGLLMQTIVRVK